MTRPTWVLRGLIVLYAAFLALALFSPTSDRQVVAVDRFGRVLAALHAPSVLLHFERLEVLSNLLLVVPLTFLATLAFARPSWRDWTAYAFLAASLVELIQGLLLPSRQAAYSDVVANTAGAFVGAVLGAALLHLARPMLRSRRSTAR